jgi:glycosyltransferase involved in cell wall biosynthesis
MSRPSILFLAHLLPWPLEGGGQIKSYHTIQALAASFDIKLLAFIRKPEEAENIEPLTSLCPLGIATVPLPRTKVSNARTALSSLISGRSFIIARDAATEMQEEVSRCLSQEEYHLLWVDHLQMAQFVPTDTGSTRVVLDEHNIEFRIPQRLAETVDNPLVRWYAQTEWPRLRRFERRAILRADLTLAVSPEDEEGLCTLAPEKISDIAAIPIGVDTEYFGVARRQPGSRTLLSIGTMYWPPNVEGMHYFCRDIYPKIKRQMTDVRLNLVGARPVASIVALGEADQSIQVTSSVPDVRPYAEDCGAFIVPLLSGSGMRVKILNALAMGLPVVSTTVGAEGIEVRHGRDILLADTPEAFADAVVSLLENPTYATNLGIAGRHLVEERYSWPVIGARLRGLLSQRFMKVTQ